MISPTVVELYHFHQMGSSINRAGFSEILQGIMALKFKPNMLEHSFWSLKASTIIPNNFLLCLFSLTWILGFYLDSLKNGTKDNCEMNFSNVGK